MAELYVPDIEPVKVMTNTSSYPSKQSNQDPTLGHAV